MCIARKEDKENEEGNVKKIRDKKIEKIQKCSLEEIQLVGFVKYYY